MVGSKKRIINFHDTKMEDILDSLPIGISIQNRDRIVVYENATIVDWFGSTIGKHCYERFNYLRNKNEKHTICNDCPGFVSLNDFQTHSIIRETKSKQGKELILEITHYPIRSSIHETPELYVEMIKDVTYKKLRLRHEEGKDYSILDDMYVGISVFNGMDELNYYIYSDIIPFLSYKEVLPYFYQKLNTYWTQAIGQGHNWQEGLFGPLPLLDVDDYLSMVYSFNKPTFELKNEKLCEECLMLLILMIPRTSANLFTEREKIAKFIEEYIDQFETDEDMRMNFSGDIFKEKLINFLKTK